MEEKWFVLKDLNSDEKNIERLWEAVYSLQDDNDELLKRVDKLERGK